MTNDDRKVIAELRALDIKKIRMGLIFDVPEDATDDVNAALDRLIAGQFPSDEVIEEAKVAIVKRMTEVSPGTAIMEWINGPAGKERAIDAIEYALRSLQPKGDG